jgi:uracil-DNA glycosylase
MEVRRAALLDAMGVARYVRRGGAAEPTDSIHAVPVADQAVAPEPPRIPSPPSTKASPVRPTLLDRQQPAKVVEPADQPTPAVPDRTGLDWPELRAAVSACRLCNLCESRTQTVFGVGDERAEWMIVGEAPGADEDRQGEPFVGRAGQLLNAMLEAVGHPRASVYIANVLKCRPPANRDPLPEEVRHCLPNLHRQIDLVSPKLILCVGRVAAQNLLGVETPLGQLRGKVHRLGVAQRPVVVTYHPAYLLRSPNEKRKAWTDLKFALEVANGCRT